MNNYEFTINGARYVRASKSAAKRVFSRGDTVIICPVNLRPDSMWSPRVPIAHSNSSEFDFDREFERYVNEFEFYNCTCNETGRYIAYYVKA